MAMFSERSAIPREDNALAHARRAHRHPILDLTMQNPTVAGIPYDEAAIRAALSDPAALRYEPHPFGVPSAREAVAAQLATEGVNVDAGRIVLCASTSEAYAYLFTLLCDRGDEVLVPEPCYPLLSHLARLSEVSLASYPLRYDGRWHADASALWEAISERTRAIVVVSPNNPTGNYLSRDEGEALAALGLPLIVDEVFACYPLEASEDRTRAANLGDDALVFALDGLSKRAALPQMKLGWCAISGPERAVDDALARLEIIADTYLSVATPVQVALPALLASADVPQRAIQVRARENLAMLRELFASSAVSIPRVEGGWYAPLRLPATRTDEQWALALLERGVHAHPGYFYDFPSDEAWLVTSLLTPTQDLSQGAEELLALVRQVG